MTTLFFSLLAFVFGYSFVKLVIDELVRRGGRGSDERQGH